MTSLPPTIPPPTRRDNVQEILHGVEIADPYRWLEDQESVETRAWIEAQDTYTAARLDAWPGREQVRARLTELMQVDAVGMPIERGGSYFFSKRLASQDLPVLYRRVGYGGADEVLIDPHSLSADQSVNISLLDVSEDGSLLLYGVRQGGEDEVEARLFDVAARQDLPDCLPKARYFTFSLTHDKKGFYYTLNAAEGPRLRHHALGSDSASDTELFGEGLGPEKLLISELSEDGRWLLLTVLYGSAGQKTELYLKDVANDGPVSPIVTDIEARFEGEIAGDKIYLKTTWDAPNSRLLVADLNNLSREHWREIVPTHADVVLQGFSLAGGKLFVNTLENVSSHLREYAPDGTLEREIELPTLGSVSGMAGRWNSDEAFFAFASFPVPAAIYRYDIATGERDLWAKQEVPIDPAAFEVQQVFYPSKDGTKIPMFLVHRKGLTLDGARPTLLYGYGGFSASLTPFFSSQAALWAERGGVYAVANLRGGGEYGEAWHQAGMLDNKQNVFDDFIGAAEWLIANNITNPAKLAISGGSNGGLLVGAALTQRPELFRAVVCSVPLLDMLRYHKFLVAQYWVPEYGSAEDAHQFKTLYAYSPYHRVVAGTKYPAVLFVTGDADTRVAPLHARKMAALLQAATGSGADRPVLLHYDTKAGHSAGQPLRKTIEDVTDSLSFLFWQLGE